MSRGPSYNEKTGIISVVFMHSQLSIVYNVYFKLPIKENFTCSDYEKITNMLDCGCNVDRLCQHKFS